MTVVKVNRGVADDRPQDLIINTADVATLNTTHPQSEYASGSKAYNEDTGDLYIQGVTGWKLVL